MRAAPRCRSRPSSAPLSDFPASGFVPGHHQIEAYGRGGFRFAGMSHRGSILALPSGIAAWPILSVAELRPDLLVDALREQPRLDVLILGTGRDVAFVSDTIRAPFREAGISLDAMQTGPAARTYNVLVAEGRRVGAALIAVK